MIYLKKKKKLWQMQNCHERYGVIYSKTCVKWLLSKRPEIGFQDQLSLNAGQKYCRILSNFIKLPVRFAIKIFVLSIFEWPFFITQVLLYMIF